MAWAPDYTDAAAIKTIIGVEGSGDDGVIAVAITAASRAIDQACNRQFGKLSSAAARYYRVAPASTGYGSLASDPFDGRPSIEIADLMDSSGLIVKFDQTGTGTFGETVTAFDLWPWNAAADGKPWTHMVLRDSVTSPSGRRRVEITAKWGWNAIPAVVVQACTQQVLRLYKRKDAPFGVAGSPDMGSEMRLLAKLDPDAARMLEVVRRPWVAV